MTTLELYGSIVEYRPSSSATSSISISSPVMLTEAFATPSATSALPSLSKSQNTLPESFASLSALRLTSTDSPADTSPMVVSSIIKRTPWFSMSYEVFHEPGTTIAEVLPDSFVIGI